jgi:UDP-N-acetylglucosamine 2-epimerase
MITIKEGERDFYEDYMDWDMMIAYKLHPKENTKPEELEEAMEYSRKLYQKAQHFGAIPKDKEAQELTRAELYYAIFALDAYFGI